MDSSAIGLLLINSLNVLCYRFIRSIILSTEFDHSYMIRIDRPRVLVWIIRRGVRRYGLFILSVHYVAACGILYQLNESPIERPSLPSTLEKFSQQKCIHVLLLSCERFPAQFKFRPGG